jgi:hypothetical protein
MTQLELPADSRAAALLARLDAGYFEFTNHLPPPLQELARERSTFTGIAGEEPFRVSGMNPGVTCTPWLFWELVQDLDDDSILQLAEAGSLIVLASVLLDHLVDGQASRPGEISLLHQALYEGGWTKFRAILPAKSTFWPHFERLGSEHLAGLAAELDAQSNPQQFTFDNFVAMVPAKFSPIVITMAAFVEATGQRDLLAPIEASIKDLAIASQLLDDMGDWQDDLEKGHLTYYMTRLAPPEAWQASEWPSTEDLQARIDADWMDIEYMRMVQEWLDRSVAAVQELPCTRWLDYLNGYRDLAEAHSKRFKARHFLHIIDPIVNQGSDTEGTDNPSEP